MKLKSLLLMVLVASSQLFYAQNADNKFAISLYGGLNHYKGDLGNGLLKFNPINPLGALSLSTYVSPSFDLGVQGSYGKLTYNGSYLNTFIDATQNVDFGAMKYEGFMYLDYKLANGYILSKESFIAPFLSLGIGLAGYNELNGKTLNTFPMDLITPVGAGLKFNITKNLAITYKYMYMFTNHDEHDLARTDDVNDFIGSKSDAYGEHLLGLAIALGAPKDSDKDGVADNKDKCPNTPNGVKVDANGCPLDGDGDNIADYLDKCPAVAGIAQFEGCPDSDGDGVQDSQDKCANTPAGVKVDSKGCPLDKDGDGIADYLDKCPNVAGLAKFNGCPDTDADGIQDALDKCPTVAGLEKFDGCPDTDLDGIPDNLDKCPTVAGIAANKGCPEVKAEVKKIFAQALQGIQFETAKADIKKQSFPILDEVVKIMQDNPEYIVIVNGHTDSQGNDAYNQELSDKRSASVMQYLINKGISPARLSAKGYGESQPIADNKTAKGRYLNRRVEFKVEF